MRHNVEKQGEVKSNYSKGGSMASGGGVDEWSIGQFQTIRDWDSKINPNGVRVYENVEGFPVLKKNKIIYVYKTKKQAQEHLNRINQRINKDNYADGGSNFVGSFMGAILIVTVMAVSLTSCTKEFKERAAANEAKNDKFREEHKSVRRVTLLTLEGDTVVITGGATCHIDIKK